MTYSRGLEGQELRAEDINPHHNGGVQERSDKIRYTLDKQFLNVLTPCIEGKRMEDRQGLHHNPKVPAVAVSFVKIRCRGSTAECYCR